MLTAKHLSCAPDVVDLGKISGFRVSVGVIFGPNGGFWHSGLFG